MRIILSFTLLAAASPAFAQVRSAPAGAPAAPGAAGAVSAASLGPIGAVLPVSALQAPAAGLAPLPTLLGPVGARFAPPDGQAPASAASAVLRAPVSPTVPTLVGATGVRPNLVPPEQGLVLPRAAPALSRDAAVPEGVASRTPSRAPTGRGERGARSSWASAARRLSLVAPWLRPGFAGDDLVRSLDSLFSGRLSPGSGPSRTGASGRHAGDSPFAPAASPRPAPALARSGPEASPAPLERRALRALTGATPRSRELPVASGFSDAAGRDFPAALVEPRRTGSGAPARWTVATGREEAGSPPRLLRLGRLEAPSGRSGMGLRIEDSPARPMGVSAAEAQESAAAALARRPPYPPYFTDRLLQSRDTPPAPAASSDHGWLAYWTAAAASRVVIARSF